MAVPAGHARTRDRGPRSGVVGYLMRPPD
jgi:hypothetical protein